MVSLGAATDEVIKGLRLLFDTVALQHTVFAPIFCGPNDSAWKRMFSSLHCAGLHQKRVTIHDIAKKLGVSKTTVALALRNHHRISEGRRKQIRKLATEMGYVPDPLLSALASYRSQIQPAKIQNAIAWINHWEQPERLRGAYREFDAYWRGAQAAARRYGYRLEEVRWEANYSARRFEQILLTRAIRGVLVPPHPKVPDWGNFDWDTFSVIRFGLSVPRPDSHLVTSDHQRAVVMALRTISSYGYEHIGMVVQEQLDRNVGGNYTGGYYSAQKLFKVPGIESLLVSRESDSEVRAKQQLQKWLEKTKPNAILTADPFVPRALKELGYSIPKDIAIAGTSLDVPADAGIDQHSEAIGQMAVEMLISQINLNERGEPKNPARILIESRWRDGATLPRLKSEQR